MPLSPLVQVSVVIPVYNEEANLADLVARVGGAMQRSGKSFELICVDDGSRDGSAAALEALAADRPWLKPLYLIRNYGQSAALQAGFDAAQGEIIVTLDGDLQNDPEDVPELLKLLDERPDIDVISGWRKDRQDRTVSRKLALAAAAGSALGARLPRAARHALGARHEAVRRRGAAARRARQRRAHHRARLPGSLLSFRPCDDGFRHRRPLRARPRHAPLDLRDRGARGGSGAIARRGRGALAARHPGRRLRRLARRDLRTLACRAHAAIRRTATRPVDAGAAPDCVRGGAGARLSERVSAGGPLPARDRHLLHRRCGG
ncbi:MAG: glycosyltransferase [Betaproteobacteria bacterium]|nr:MAG: glycosyltransferase [Betaproteobacteria bacterium]